MKDFVKDSIRNDLEATRSTFHALLGSLSEADLRKQSLNPGWTNGEILAHMLFVLILMVTLLPLTRLWGWLPKESSRPFAWLLNAFTGPFNRINALGARGQGRVFTYRRLDRLYDYLHFSLLKQLDSIKDEEWQRGMYYPTQWDSNFDEFMTIEKLFHYTVTHFDFHLAQIARD
jgi:hypothetical protein